MNTLQPVTLTIDGIDVFIDGNGPQTLVMLHGWPDSYRLWDATVETLKSNYRCVRFTLPGFDTAAAPRPTSLDAMTALIARVISNTSAQAPVALLVHDWGCIFGYELVARHPALVDRLVAIDIGDHNSGAFLHSLTAKAKAGMVMYQLWLALAWKMGNTLSQRLANRMTVFMAKTMLCPQPAEALHWQVNYPYAMQWFGMLGGFKSAAKVRVTLPTLYFYGTKKPFMFHSPKWLATLQSTPGCKVQAMRAGHWVMLDQPAEFTSQLLQWLEQPLPKTTTS